MTVFILDKNHETTVTKIYLKIYILIIYTCSSQIHARNNAIFQIPREPGCGLWSLDSHNLNFKGQLGPVRPSRLEVQVDACKRARVMTDVITDDISDEFGRYREVCRAHQLLKPQ